MTQVRYISCTDTAKLIRGALKRSFPRTKFSVKSHVYSGGASINVSWTDGPTTALVDSITQAYSGGRFDGMIDMAYSAYSWLMPDGTATPARDKGTVGSGGCNESKQYMQPSFKSELVHFGANHVFSRREYTPAFYRRAVESLAHRYGVGLEMKVSSYGTPMLAEHCQSLQIGNQYASDVVYRELSKRMPANV